MNSWTPVVSHGYLPLLNQNFGIQNLGEIINSISGPWECPHDKGMVDAALSRFIHFKYSGKQNHEIDKNLQ